MDMKRFFLYFITIAALVLAGCGGGGNGPGPTSPTPPEVLTCGSGTQQQGNECLPTVPIGMANATAAAFAPAIAKPDTGMVFDDDLDRGNPEALTLAVTSTVGDNGEATPQVTVTDDNDGNAVTTPAFEMGTHMPLDLNGDEADVFAGSRFGRTAQEAVAADPDADPVVEMLPGIVDYVTVYTDQVDPMMTPFGDIYDISTGGDTADLENDPHDALDLQNIDGEGTTADEGMIRFTVGMLPSGTEMVDLMVDEDETLDGMFDGASGEYRCIDNNGCSVSVDKDGKIDGLSDVSGFIFVPGMNAMIPVENEDYLSFGYWVRTTTTTDDEGKSTTAYAVETYASGGMPYPATQIQNLSGEATYTGSATGLYVQKTDVHGDGEGLVPTSTGQFGADVELMATFGTPNTVGSTYHNSIRGTVENFTDSDGGDLGWTLNLMKAAITNGQNTYVDGETCMGMMCGGDDPPAGGWEGQFFGDADTDADTNDNYPTSTAGRFNGHFDGSDDGPVGHVIGAFGAHLDE